MRYAIKVNHFSFRLVLLQHRRRRRRLPRVLSALSLSSPPFTHTHLQRGNLAPAATVSQPACTPATSPGTSTLSLSLLSGFGFACSPLCSLFFSFLPCVRWGHLIFGGHSLWFSLICDIVFYVQCAQCVSVCVRVCACAPVCVCVCVYASLFAGGANRLLLIFGAACFNLCSVCLYCRLLLVLPTPLLTAPLFSPSSFLILFLFLLFFYSTFFKRTFFFGCGSHLLLLLYW